jgi:hypothetical protein
MPHSDPIERKRIAKAAVAARERNKKAKPAEPPRDDEMPPLRTIEDYDRQAGRPLNWGDIKRREEVRGEFILNEARAEELDAKRFANAKARGEHLTREQHRAAVASVVAAIIEASSTLTTAAVSLHAPEQQPMARHQFESALAQWRESAMALIKENKP